MKYTCQGSVPVGSAAVVATLTENFFRGDGAGVQEGRSQDRQKKTKRPAGTSTVGSYTLNK